jgi:hypothetical protein
MKKIIFSFLCVIILVFTYSCGDPDEKEEEIEYVEVSIINTTIEDVVIYYKTLFVVHIYVAVIEKNIYMDYPRKLKLQKGKYYYAEGNDSKQDYGGYFVYFPHGAWYIR